MGDEGNLKFLANPLIKDFMKSPVACWCRINRGHLPLLSRYSPEEMLKKIMNPSEQMKAKSPALVKQMMTGGLVQDRQPGEQENQNFKKAKALVTKVFLSDCVQKAKSNLIRNYLLRNHPDIPGSTKLKGCDKKPSKLENLREAIGREYPN